MNRPRHRTDGDGWVECTCGQRHWGLYGSAGLMLVDAGHSVLLQHRAEWSHYGGTWGVPGGARASGEPALNGAIREAHEEAAIPPEHVQPTHVWVEDHGAWSYTTVVGTCDVDFEPYPADPESLDIAWVGADEVGALPLHPAFGELWPSIRKQAFRRLVLVVDAANVVGSRPDGWWRDRAGAASRLRDQLSTAPPLPGPDFGLPAATHWWPQVHLVVEGAARDIGAKARSSTGDGGSSAIGSDDDGGGLVRQQTTPVPPPVIVERASDSGDDHIVAVVDAATITRPDDHVVVVTADRELRTRVERAGASSIGPGALLSMITSTG